MKSKQKSANDLKTLSAAYHRGWAQQDKKRGEFYLTIMNDLAENIFIPRRHTAENIAEALGWMAHEQHLMAQHLCKVHDKMMRLATESLVSQMEEGLFGKAAYPKAERSVLLDQDEHKCPSGVGNKNPVETAKHSVQRPARSRSRADAKH